MRFYTSIAIIFAALAGHAAQAAAPYKDALIKDVPHVKQRPDFCGEACAEMFLRKLGHKISQDDVFAQAGLSPEFARGCYSNELSRALRSIGFAVGATFFSVATAKAADEMEAQWQALHADLAQGVPSIVCMHYDDRPAATEHFRLILGYDAKSDEVIYNEPAEANGAYRRMKRELFISLWPLKYSPQQWTIVRMRLEPGAIKPPAPSDGFTPADFCQHIMALKKKIGGSAFTVLVQPPFVVIGDESAEMVKTRAENTVRWAVDKLKQDYFKKDPDDILDIWLFRNSASYEKNAKAIFNDTPNTPYGYYSAANKALVMNIATGGGTLVHEIVHPFMRSNFPACPDWFNEGLGSLYEQSQERGGHIYGATNWRLAGLQKAIKGVGVPSFETLTGAANHDFYSDDPGTNYAQARYLCYYLQEKGLLVKFYKEFTANQQDDPTGYKTLKKILDEKDMDAFKKKWEAFVLKLRFP